MHRDIKPSNLLIRDRDGLVKLADMGAGTRDRGRQRVGDHESRDYGRDRRLYGSGAGSGQQAGRHAQRYLFAGLHVVPPAGGKAPYPDGDLMNKLRAHAMQPVPDPRDWNDNVPAGIVAVLQRMMAKKADDRYQTPKELLADLNSPALLRSNFSADQLSLLAASHAGGPAVDDDEPEVAESSPAPSKSKKSKTPAPASKSSSGPRPQVEREEPEEEDDAPSTPSKFKKLKPTAESPSGKRPANRESLPPRGSADPSPETSSSGKKAKTERVLPGRIDQPLLSELRRLRWIPIP